MPEETVCRRVVYHGRVQGVGFRFTTHRIAKRHPVGGFVRNQQDGTVELVAAGTVTAVREFLAELADAMRGNIAQADESDGPDGIPTSGFEIRH